jgi:hypothetical protein
MANNRNSTAEPNEEGQRTDRPEESRAQRPQDRPQRSATVRELYVQGTEARDQIAEVATAVRRLMRDGDAMLRERMRREPYATVAAAAGLGYVLGGGLSPSIVRLVTVLGGRMAFETVLHRLAAANDTAKAAS